MSKYSENQTQFKDKDLLCESLRDMGYTVEYHAVATNLYGYHGDRRQDTANVIIRREFVGSASNDVGFKLLANGTYAAIISEYDNSCKFTPKVMDKLRQTYAVKGLQRQLSRKGCRTTTKTVNGKVEICFVKA